MMELKYFWEAEPTQTDLPNYVLTIYLDLELPQRFQVIPLITLLIKVQIDVLRQRDSCLLEISVITTSLVKIER